MRIHQSTADDCGRRMQYKLEHPQYFGGSVRAMGSGYHKGIELAYLDRMEHGYFDPHNPKAGQCGFREYLEAAREEFEMICDGSNTSHVSEEGRERGGFIWNKAVPDLETGNEILEVMLNAYFDQGWWPEDWNVLAVEQFFELPWIEDMGWTRGGSIDLILHHPETDTIVGDDQKTTGKGWNTGKEKPRKNIQGPWYSWAIRELHPGHQFYTATFSVMTYKGKFDRREATPTEDHINAAAELLYQTVVNYKMQRASGLDMPANPSSTLCSPEYCDYFSICPHGQILD